MRASLPAPFGCGEPRSPTGLQDRKADGLIRIGVLTAGDVTARAVRSRVVWNGGTVQLTYS